MNKILKHVALVLVLLALLLAMPIYTNFSEGVTNMIGMVIAFVIGAVCWDMFNVWVGRYRDEK